MPAVPCYYSADGPAARLAITSLAPAFFALTPCMMLKLQGGWVVKDPDEHRQENYC